MSDRIWAPWRMQYIRSPKPAETGCVLCERAKLPPSKEGLVLAHVGRAYVVLNRYPYAAGHVMVVPDAHVARLSDLDPSESDELFRLVRSTTTCLESALKCDGLNVGMNLGRAAGAGIEGHLHVHVVPRWVGDLNFMPVIGDVHVLPEHLDETWDHLAPAFRAMQGTGP